MADINLTQAQADALIGMEKHRTNEERHNFPMGGQSLVLPLQSPDKREAFLLDLSRGMIDLAKVKMQNRARQVVVLVRLDIAGRPTAHRARIIHMIYEIQRLLDDYLAWLKDRTKLREIDDWVEITTPYLDRHNDYLQIYAKQHNGGFLLTDDGYTMTDLEQGGCKLDSRKRQDLLKMTLNGFGVQLRQNALEIHATHETFPLRKHNLVQAMLAVNDMFCLAMPMVASLFHEDVVNWLELHDVRYTPNVKFTGKSGYDHMFDFVIPKLRRQPERILKTINRPNRDTAQVVAFSWIDTKEARPSDSKAYAFVNDTEQTVSGAVLDALQNYEMRPVPWSEREKVREELAA